MNEHVSREHAKTVRWSREAVIISLLLICAVATAIAAAWKSINNEAQRQKQELSRPLKTPRLEPIGKMGKDASGNDKPFGFYKTTASDAVVLEIPISISDMKRLPLTGNKCIALLVTIFGPDQVLPVFEEEKVLTVWEYKTTSPFPIVATDHCSISGPPPATPIAQGAPVNWWWRPPLSASAPVPPQATPGQGSIQKALWALTNWAGPRHLGKELPGIVQWRSQPPQFPADEANKLMTMIVSHADTDHGVRLRYGSDNNLAAISFTTAGAEHILFLGQQDDFKRAFESDGENLKIPLQVRRTVDANEAQTSTATVALRAIIREVLDTQQIAPSDKARTWPEALNNLFMPHTEGPYSVAWTLGPDSCRSKKKVPGSKYVRVYSTDEAWEYVPLTEKCQ